MFKIYRVFSIYKLYHLLLKNIDGIELYKAISYFYKGRMIYLDNIELFRLLFAFWHTVYKLDIIISKKGKYRIKKTGNTIKLIRIPQTGRCRFLLDGNAGFCLKECNGYYCDTHKSLSTPAIPTIREYYLDTSNYIKMTEENVNFMMKGIWDAISNWDNIKRAFNTIGCSFDDSIEVIKSKYRQLIKVYHPDRNINGIKQIQEINHAYNTINKYIGIFNAL